MITIAGFFLATIIISGLLCDLFKIILGRARPHEYFTQHLYGFYFWQFHNGFWSCPSGHATTIAAIATAGYILWPRYLWFFIFLFFMVAISRVITQQHYLSDVMLGSYLGFITSFWLSHLVKPPET